MERSAVNAEKGSKIDSSKRIASRARPARENTKIQLDFASGLVQRARCWGCGPSLESIAGVISKMPVAQRRAAALSLQRTKGNRFVQGLAVQAKCEPNCTRLPDQLKAGIESLSGIGMSDVRVHANSDRPAELNALAYTQGNQIHLGPGQERHLPHEAWHVVQQKQGRVRPTMQMKGVGINEDDGLEREAAEISEEMRCKWSTTSQPRYLEKYTPISAEPIQLMKFQFNNKEYDTDHLKGEDRKRVLEELKQRFPAASPPDIQEAIEILEQGFSVEKIIRGDIPSGQTPITAAATAVTPTETEEMEITDENTIQIGGGVRFKVKIYNSMTDWIDGYCHKIDGKKYQVYVANRDNRALFGNYVWVDLDKEDKIEPYKEIGMRQPKRPRSDLPLPEAKGQEPTRG